MALDFHKNLDTSFQTLPKGPFFQAGKTVKPELTSVQQDTHHRIETRIGATEIMTDASFTSALLSEIQGVLQKNPDLNETEITDALKYFQQEIPILLHKGISQAAIREQVLSGIFQTFQEYEGEKTVFENRKKRDSSVFDFFRQKWLKNVVSPLVALSIGNGTLKDTPLENTPLHIVSAVGTTVNELVGVKSAFGQKQQISPVQFSQLDSLLAATAQARELSTRIPQFVPEEHIAPEMPAFPRDILEVGKGIQNEFKDANAHFGQKGVSVNLSHIQELEGYFLQYKGSIEANKNNKTIKESLDRLWKYRFQLSQLVENSQSGITPDHIKDFYSLYKQIVDTFRTLLSPYENVKNLPKADGMFYIVQRDETYVKITEKLFNLEDAAAQELIKANKISATKLRAKQKIDLSVLFEKGKVGTREIAPEIKEKYSKGVLSTLIEKGGNFYLNIPYEKLWDPQTGREAPMCAGSMRLLDLMDYQNLPPSQPEGSNRSSEHGHAFEVLPIMLKNGLIRADTGPSPISIQFSTEKPKGNSIAVEGGFYHFAIDFEKMAGFKNTVYDNAELDANKLGYIFWQYNYTREWRGILETYLQKGGSHSQIPAVSMGSHYTKIIGRSTQTFSYQDISERFSDEERPMKNVTAAKVLDSIIPDWNDTTDKRIHIDREHIFSKVQVHLEAPDGSFHEASLFDIFSKVPGTEIFYSEELGKDHKLYIDDVWIVDEYLGKGRFLSLAGLLTQVEDGSGGTSEGGAFYPTDLIYTPADLKKQYRDAVIPSWIETLEHIQGVEIAKIESPRKTPTGIKVSAKELGIAMTPVGYNFKMVNIEEGQKKLREYYNKHRGNLPEYKEDASNRVFYLYNKKSGTFSFVYFEANFDEMSKRWIKAGRYSKEDVEQMKRILRTVRPEILNETLETHAVVPLLQFEKTFKKPEFKVGELRPLENAQKLSSLNAVKNITPEQVNMVRNVSNDPFEQAILLGLIGFESGSGGVDIFGFKIMEKGFREMLKYSLDVTGWREVTTAGLMQSNIEDGALSLMNFLVRPAEENETEFLISLRKAFKPYESYFKNPEIRQAIVDNNQNHPEVQKLMQTMKPWLKAQLVDGNAVSVFIGYLLFKDKRKQVNQYASEWYGVSYNTELDDAHRESIEALAIASYTGELQRHVIQGIHYNSAKLRLAWKEGIPPEEMNIDVIKKHIPQLSIDKEKIEKAEKESNSYPFLDGLTKEYPSISFVFEAAKFGVKIGESIFREIKIAFKAAKKEVAQFFKELYLEFFPQPKHEKTAYDIESTISERIEQDLIELLTSPDSPYKQILDEEGVYVDRESIHQSLTYKGEYTKNPHILFGGSSYQKNVDGRNAVNAMQAVRIIYKKTFDEEPFIFMDPEFREGFKYTIRKTTWDYLKTATGEAWRQAFLSMVGLDSGITKYDRGGNVLKLVQKVWIEQETSPYEKSDAEKSWTEKGLNFFSGMYEKGKKLFE